MGEQHRELKASAETTASLEAVCFHRRPKKGQYPHKPNQAKKKTTPTKKVFTRCGKEPHPREKCLQKM
jgi:hypothetical protein